MASLATFSFLMASSIIFVSEALPVGPLAMVMGPHGVPMMISIREKRQPVAPYPHRAMMFTGYYRPIRHSNNGQTTDVFAHGNSVGGGAYVRGKKPTYIQPGPEPTYETEIANSEAETAAQDTFTQQEQDDQSFVPNGNENTPPDQNNEFQPPPNVTEIPAVQEGVTPVVIRPPKPQKSSKGNKIPVPNAGEENDEEEDDDDDDDDEDDGAHDESPYVPFKGTGKQRGRVPNLNNFFPMVFSFPKSYGRNGAEGSLPGMITAIANSYSTGKGGVASSVATAYGGSSLGKKKRTKSSEE